MFSVTPAVKGAARHAFFVLLFYSLLFTLFFSPILFQDYLLAPGGGRLGDTLLYHLTYFQSKKVFWDTLLGAGFPMTADPQVLTWYPPAMLLSLLPGAWNLFVISAYVLASCFTYGYVYALTESRLASLVSGIVYGMCGFMMAHLGHTTIIHVAAWLPLILWSLEMLRRRFARGWFAVGCAAVACCVLAGHLQIVAYSLLLGVCYAVALGWRAPVGRRRYYVVCSLLFLLGVGLTALQLLPASELAGLSMRSEFSFGDLSSYSFPVRQTVLLLFPAVLGGLPQYGATPYLGQWNLTEVTGYAGLLPLMLAAVGFVVTRRKAVSIFWLCAGVMAFLLALGDQIPLAYLTYHLPVIGKFRAPARHLLEMTLAVSVLAGIGVQAILRQTVTKRLLIKVVAAAALLMLAALGFLISNHAREFLPGGTTHLNALPWQNAAVATPLVVFLVTGLALLYWHTHPNTLFRKTLLVVALALDVGSLGWFYSWRFDALRRDVLAAPAFVSDYQTRLRAANQRVLPVRGTWAAPSELPPNLSRLWGVASASAHSPLNISRVMQMLSMRPDDLVVGEAWKDPDDKSINLMGVRYIFLPRGETITGERGVSWAAENMNIWLGAGCDQPPKDSVRFRLPAPVKATSVGVVTRLACSVGVPEGTEVVRVAATGADGSMRTLTMLAGRDTAEWAYDCPSVTPQMKHGRAHVFSSFAARMSDDQCEGHYYVTMLDVGGGEAISSLEFRWAGRQEAISIEKITLFDELTQKSVPLPPLQMNDSRWRFVEEAGEARIYENLQASPRAWLVPEVLGVKPEDALAAIKTSRLPDGRPFDPSRAALVEAPAPREAHTADPQAVAQITYLSETVMEVRTTSASPAFLVTSDVYYPGWRAAVDGAQVQLFRADYALRGVEVPAGEHVVRFEFRPKTFYYGAAISAFSFLALAGFLALQPASRKSDK